MTDLGPYIVVASFILAAATFWNTSRKSVLDALNTQIKILTADIEKLQRHVAECESTLNEFRSTNQWLTDQIKTKDYEDRERRRNWLHR